MYNKDWLSKWAEYSPIKTVIRDADTHAAYTYRQLNALACFLSLHFQKTGLKKGDRIAVLAEYCPEYIVLLGVAQKLGIILVPLNYRLSSRELTYMINNATPACLIVESKFQHLIDTDSYAHDVRVMGLGDLAGLLKHQDDESLHFDAVEIEEDHPLFLLYTSGTTGFPKGAIYSHKMAFWNAINTEMRLDITSNDHTVICMPPFHTGGWNVLMTPFLLHGASFTLLRKFDPDQVLQLLDEEEATLFMGVPTMLKMMEDSPLFKEANLSSVRYFIVGGEAMPVPLIKTWEEKGIPIRQGYGLTEVGPNVVSLHHDDAIRKIGSIGTFNFYVEAKLIKTENGEQAKPGEEGELWMKGPMVTPGYWKNPEATEKAIEEDWFKTGDILVEDDEGYFYVRDRIKNMFISGGENVYPAEVEAYIRTHPYITDVAVIGTPDEKWGEVGKAIIVSKSRTLTPEALQTFCREGLAKFKVPRHFTFIPELPKTASGKIDRKALIDQFADT